MTTGGVGDAKIQRRLAAILAADIAGYSALMGADEETTVRDLKAHQSAILPIIPTFGGRVIDTAGDGILAEFSSVLNALKCALAIQKEMASRNAAVEPSRQMQFRIGINQGDVVYDDTRLYGDGVNVAARIEAIAEPGGICLSGKVFDEVRGKIEVQFTDIGEQQLKNIAEPVRAYRVGASLPGSQRHPRLSIESKRAHPSRRRLLQAVSAVSALGAVSAGGWSYLSGSNLIRATGETGKAVRTKLKQEIKYARAKDGVRIAYATAGSGPPLVKAGNWLSHLEYEWETPVWRHLMQRLAEKHTLIRYDARGNGMSDWEVKELSLDAWVEDLRTVVDAVGIKRFPLFGISQGCAICVTYAVRYPERVSHLILYGGFAVGARKRSPETAERSKAFATLMRDGWGQDNPALRQMFTLRLLPGATKEQMDSFNELQRRSTSPDGAARYVEAWSDIDIWDLLPKVTTPTLVMHVRDDSLIAFNSGRELAAGIPGARFVALDGKSHPILEGAPGSERFFEEVELFLKG
jgi:class 3 adenylate cyclase/pimeloyl-ACP methyl ester carboxylesterase